MSVKKKKKLTVRGIRNRMIMIYTLLILTVAAASGFLLLDRLRKADTEKLTAQSRALALRTASSLDCFCESAEGDCNRVFKSKTVMDFDPVNKIYPDYENTSLRNTIKDELLSLAAGKNYNDFFILYSDHSTIGKVSNSADNDILRDSALPSAMLGDRYDFWQFSPSGSSRKMYYMRRISDHSMFIMSFYIEELDRFILASDDSPDAAVILTDETGEMILTNLNSEDTGSRLPERALGMFTSENETAISEEFIASTVTAGCGWKVASVMERGYRYNDTAIVVGAAVAAAAALTLVSVFTGMVGTAGLVLAEINAADSEFYDPMTGRLNEYGLDEKISELLETSLVGSTYAMIMIGIKDAELILSTMSEEYRRNICFKLIDTAEDFLGERRLFTGRISGDRIVLLADFSEFDLFKAHDELKRVCSELCGKFEGFTADESGTLKLGIGMGVCIYPDNAEDHDTMIERSALALEKTYREDGASMAIYAPDENEDSKDGEEE